VLPVGPHMEEVDLTKVPPRSAFLRRWFLR